MTETSIDMKHIAALRLEEQTRRELWQRLIEAVETYLVKVETRRVTPELDPDKIRALLKRFDFAEPLNPIEAMNFVVENLWQHQVHVSHPMYHGLFNPAPTTISIVASSTSSASSLDPKLFNPAPTTISIVAGLEGIAHEIVSSGKAWLSTVRLGGAIHALRACITNYRTGPDEVRALVQVLDETRQQVRKSLSQSSHE